YRQDQGHWRRCSNETDQPFNEGGHAEASSPAPTKESQNCGTGSRSQRGCNARRLSKAGSSSSCKAGKARTACSQRPKATAATAPPQASCRSRPDSSQADDGRKDSIAPGKIRPSPLRAYHNGASWP